MYRHSISICHWFPRYGILMYCDSQKNPLMETKHHAALEMQEHLVKDDWVYIEPDVTN